MLKDIFKFCKANNISFTNNGFAYNNVKVSYLKFISFINKRKFTIGLENSIKLAEKELFINNQDSFTNK